MGLETCCHRANMWDPPVPNQMEKKEALKLYRKELFDHGVKRIDFWNASDQLQAILLNCAARNYLSGDDELKRVPDDSRIDLYSKIQEDVEKREHAATIFRKYNGDSNLSPEFPFRDEKETHMLKKFTDEAQYIERQSKTIKSAREVSVYSRSTNLALFINS